MFALLALITFVVAFILSLVGVAVGGGVNLVILGLAFIAAHLLLGWGLRRQP